MTNQQINEEEEGVGNGDLSASGAAAFSSLRGAMRVSILGIRKGFQVTEESEQQVQGGVQSHLTEITKLLEVGNEESFENVLPANPGNTLDLDAARQEIDSRLVKLIEQRGG